MAFVPFRETNVLVDELDQVCIPDASRADLRHRNLNALFEDIARSARERSRHAAANICHMTKI